MKTNITEITKSLGFNNKKPKVVLVRCPPQVLPPHPLCPAHLPPRPGVVRSWAELGRPVGAGPGWWRRDDVRAWDAQRLVRRGAAPALAAVAGFVT